VADELEVAEPVTEETPTETVEETTPSQATEEVAAEETETETTESETPIEEAETDTEESDDAPELPKKQAKKYSPELMDHYAAKYGLTSEDLKDPKQYGVLKSKIDSDIYVAELSERLAALESPTEEVVDEPAEPQRQNAPATPEERAAYQVRLRNFAKEITDPEQATAYAKSWCESQGVKYEDVVKSGNFKAEQFVEEQTMYAANLVNTILPRLLPAFIESAIEARYPTFTGMYENALHSNTWEDLRASDPNYKSLHAFGTPEFKAGYGEVAKKYGLDQMQFNDKAGRPLSAQKNVAERYRIAAQLLSGQAASPQAIQDAMNKGKEQASRTNRKVATIRGLGGAGRPTGKIAPAADKPEGGSLGDAYKREHGNSHAKSLEDLI